MLSSRMLEILAQAEPAAGAGGEAGAGAGGGSPLGFLLPMIVIFFIFYLLVFRPEGKKRKERQRMIATVKKGDHVMTTGGLLGKVWRVDDKEVVVQIDKDKDVKGRFAKSAIFEVIRPEGDPGAKHPSDDAVRELEQRAK